MHIAHGRQRDIILVSAVLLLGVLSCSAPVLVPTAEPLPSATPTWTLLPPPSSTPGPTDTPVPPTLAPDEPTPTRTTTPFSCPGAPASRLKVGDTARVTFTDGLPLRVRETPVVNNTNIIAQIPEGTEFAITGGPECAPIPNSDGSFVFWEMRVTSSGLEGWVAEGDSARYYIEPLP